MKDVAVEPPPARAMKDDEDTMALVERAKAHDQGNSREERLGRLLWHYVDRLCAGELLDREKIREDHPDLADDLLKELETFRSLSAGSDGEGPLKKLGDYQLLRQIGRGGMGIVYEAWDVPMDRHVAVKVLPVGLVAHSRSVARFVTEARISGKLQHPNIVSVYSMGIDQGVPYFAMEYVNGETLAAILEKQAPRIVPADVAATRESLAAALSQIEPSDGSVPPSKDGSHRDARPAYEAHRKREKEGNVDLSYCLQAARMFASVADGLQHAHEKGVVHRDLKPSNLILDDEGRLRILDFGLARLEGSESLTRSRDLIGTPLYMSPEQADDGKLDHRTDIYSFGAALYELLGFRPPFRGRTTQNTLSQIIHRDPRSLRESNVLVPRDLDTIVLKCLEKDPRNRYGTAEAILTRMGTFGEAVTYFEKAIDLKPDSAVAHSNLCWAYRQLRRYDEAFRACDRALELDPHLDKPHMIVGKIFLFRRDFDEALRRYEKAAAVNPLNHLAFYNQGVAYEMSGRLAEAKIAYDKAIELYPRDIRYFYNLGNVYRQLRDFDRAVEVYKRGLEVKPDHDWTHNNLGIALIETDDLDRAEFHLERAVFYAPEDPEPHIYMATVREKQENVEEALAHLDRAARLFEKLLEGPKKPGNYRALRAEYLKVLDRALRLARSLGQEERVRGYERALSGAE